MVCRCSSKEVKETAQGTAFQIIPETIVFFLSFYSLGGTEEEELIILKRSSFFYLPKAFLFAQSVDLNLIGGFL